jgi:hypothetical protein
MPELIPAPNLPEDLVIELRELISAARRQAAAAVNRALTVLYWRVGDRVRSGRGFEVTNLTRMMRFAEVYRIRRLLRRCRNNGVGPTFGSCYRRNNRFSGTFMPR